MRALLERFEILNGQNVDEPSVLLCRDVQTGKKAVLIELRSGTPGVEKGDSREAQIHHQSDGATLIQASSVVLAEDRLFAIAYPATHMNLKRNLAMLHQVNKPATEAEAIRIGRALCFGLGTASRVGMTAFCDPAWIFFEANGCLQILTLPPGQQPKVKPSAASPSCPKDVAQVITQLLNPMSGPSETEVRALNGLENSTLRSLLTHALDGSIPSLDDFARSLANFGATPPPHQRTKANFVIASALAVVLAIGFSAQKDQGKIGQEREKQNAANIRDATVATVAEWRTLALDYTDTMPPQIPEADQLLSEANKLWETSEFSQAKPIYSRANVLYEAGLKVAKEIANRRTLADGARLQAMTVGAGWLHLTASPYVEVPEAINQAQQALATGDFRLLDHKYLDASMAYDLATERFQSVPAAQLKALTQKHEAQSNADRAKYAEEAWKQVAPTAGLHPPVMAQEASDSMARGQVLLQAGSDSEASAAFQKAHDLYGAATEALIRGMVAAQQIADARDRAADAAQRWSALSKIVGSAEPDDIAQAETLLQTADGNVAAGKQDQAKSQLAAASEIYEREIAELQRRTGSQCDADLAKAKELFASLQREQAGIETNVTATRESIETLSLQLSSARGAGEHEKLLNEAQSARTAHTVTTRLLALCDAVVFSGPKYENARDSLEQAKTLALQGNKVAASALSGPAVAALESLTRLPDAMNNYLTERVAVEGTAASAQEKLGPISVGLPSIKTNLASAGKLLMQAEEQIKLGNADKARQLAHDAGLYYKLLPAETESALLSYAAKADSEYRTDTAVAALNELLELNPANEEGKRLLSQVQSKERPHDRIAIADGAWRVDGKSMPMQPSVEDLERVLGKARTLAGNAGFAFDDFGVMAVPDPTSGKIILVTAYYSLPRFDYEPHKAFPGEIEVEGVPIKHDSSMADLASSLARWNPRISQAENTFVIEMNHFRIHVSYGQSTNQIYSVSIGFR